MRRKFLAIGIMALALLAKAEQPSDSLYKKKVLSKTDIQLVMSYYHQDGNNSAVTGGIGTEHLTVSAPKITVAHTFGTYNTITMDIGADVVTSASTDRIDAIRSSASLRDTRSHGSLGYTRRLHKQDLSIGGNIGFSLESDYFSVPVAISAAYTEPSRMRSYQIAVQCAFDDLRWGRLSPIYFAPVKLIYPDELRYKEWDSIYLRQSYNIKLGFTQVLHKRLILGLYPELTVQQGLLSTSFHRVYFDNGAHRVEHLPSSRIKVPLGIRLNYFAGKRTILKTQANLYQDNFGITAGGIELEAAIKVSSVWTVSPFARVYHQSASTYFRSYMAHSTTDRFYTSDYDLSDMTTYKAGINLRYAPFAHWGKRFIFDEIGLRYSYYYQSNGLYAHCISMLIDVSTVRRSKEK
jgi:Protein of unknown function (DUF3570)